MTTITTTSSPTFLCSFHSPFSPKSSSSLYRPQWYMSKPVINAAFSSTHSRRTLLCSAARRKPTALATSSSVQDNPELRRVLQIILWAAEAVYILWLFLLPYAPGDPVWAISSDTVNSLVGLSLNFFFILPFMNFGNIIPVALDYVSLIYISRKKSIREYLGHDTDNYGRVVGIRLIDAPVLHPMSEGLFNFVIGWTFMFAPLLFTDCKRDRYKGSLDVLWGLQMFLTNTFLIPYMAIRLKDADDDSAPIKLSNLGSVMTNGATLVGLIGGGACLVSLLWALFGRMDAHFGGIVDRWEYLVGYLGSERLAYAFIWDICLYMIFQPWLIGDNLQNLQENKVVLVKYLKFVPVVGLVAYLLCLEPKEV